MLESNLRRWRRWQREFLKSHPRYVRKTTARLGLNPEPAEGSLLRGLHPHRRVNWLSGHG